MKAPSFVAAAVVAAGFVAAVFSCADQDRGVAGAEYRIFFRSRIAADPVAADAVVVFGLIRSLSLRCRGFRSRHLVVGLTTRIPASSVSSIRLPHQASDPRARGNGLDPDFAAADSVAFDRSTGGMLEDSDIGRRDRVVDQLGGIFHEGYSV